MPLRSVAPLTVTPSQLTDAPLAGGYDVDGVGVGVGVGDVAPVDTAAVLPAALLVSFLLSLLTALIHTTITTTSATVPAIEAIRVKRRRATSRSWRRLS